MLCSVQFPPDLFIVSDFHLVFKSVLFVIFNSTCMLIYTEGWEAADFAI